MTDNFTASGQFVRQNVFNPNVREISAVVQVESANEGTKIEGRWYQMGVFGQKLDRNTPQGALVTTAGFTLTREAISETGGFGRLTFRPTAVLPEDSYELRVYVDGKLAKTQPFVVSVVVPGPAGTSNTPSPAATPVRTATPAR